MGTEIISLLYLHDPVALLMPSLQELKLNKNVVL